MDGSVQRSSSGHHSTRRAQRIARSIGAGSVALIIVASGASASFAGQGHYLSSQQVRGDVSQLSLVDPNEVPQVAIDAFGKLTSNQIMGTAIASGFDELDRDSQIELGKPINRYSLDEGRGREWLEGRSEDIGGWELAILYDHRNQFCAPATIDGASSQFYLCGEMYSVTQDPEAITDLVLDNFIKLDKVTASQQEAGFPGHIIELRSGFVYTDYVTVTALDSQSLTLIGQETADEDDFARRYFSELKERDRIDRSYRGSAVPLPLYNATPEQLEERSQALQDIEDSSPRSAMKRALGVGATVLVVGLAVVALAYSLRRRDS